MIYFFIFWIYRFAPKTKTKPPVFRTGDLWSLVLCGSMRMFLGRWKFGQWTLLCFDQFVYLFTNMWPFQTMSLCLKPFSINTMFDIKKYMFWLFLFSSIPCSIPCHHRSRFAQAMCPADPRRPRSSCPGRAIRYMPAAKPAGRPRLEAFGVDPKHPKTKGLDTKWVVSVTMFSKILKKLRNEIVATFW